MFCVVCENPRPHTLPLPPIAETISSDGTRTMGLADPVDTTAASKFPDDDDSEVHSDEGVADEDEVKPSVYDDPSDDSSSWATGLPKAAPSSGPTHVGDPPAPDSTAASKSEPRSPTQEAMEFEAVKVQYADVATTLVRDNYIYYQVQRRKGASIVMARLSARCLQGSDVSRGWGAAGLHATLRPAGIWVFSPTCSCARPPAALFRGAWLACRVHAAVTVTLAMCYLLSEECGALTGILAAWEAVFCPGLNNFPGLR